jgi:hypothetical protein
MGRKTWYEPRGGPSPRLATVLNIDSVKICWNARSALLRPDVTKMRSLRKEQLLRKDIPSFLAFLKKKCGEPGEGTKPPSGNKSHGDVFY